MINKIKGLPLRIKMTGISLAVNMLVFIINIVLLVAMNRMSDRIDTVYKANLQLNEISAAIKDVQDSMTEYLDTKTSDSLEDYYRSAQNFAEMTEVLGDEITDSRLGRMERSVKNMSAAYLDEVGQTVDAKRGRNVEKYRTRYEEATRLYGYINNYIYSLNNERFMDNTESYREMLTAFRRFELFGNLIMGAVIFTTALLILNLTSNLMRPLRSLAGMADEVAKGNFEISTVPAESDDEIGVVTRAFNKMVASVQDYIEKIRQSAENERILKEKELMMETHLKDAQLKYLQAQINPHFLFNTLNAGAQLAMMEGADRTYEYVQVMSEFFRYNVKKGSRTVTIGEELELVDNYIYILNVRFSGDIHYEKDIDASLTDVEMPSMILQPIVENCVNHGIREMLGEGKIKMSVYALDDTACIRIEDNGAGMDEETVERLRNGRPASDEKKDSNGIGMDNVYARLKLFAGTDDCFSIESDGPGKGSRFTIYLDIKGSQYR
ncbi:MAG: sensor histidine kinase [Lachnospiraceae bacterium]|nr:sensor histidine kinase [Lachnospiraceae bacterium]